MRTERFSGSGAALVDALVLLTVTCRGVAAPRGYLRFDRPLEVTRGLAPLEIELEPLRAARLEGEVVDPAGRPVPGSPRHVESHPSNAESPTISART